MTDLFNLFVFKYIWCSGNCLKKSVVNKLQNLFSKMYVAEYGGNKRNVADFISQCTALQVILLLIF